MNVFLPAIALKTTSKNAFTLAVHSLKSLAPIHCELPVKKAKFARGY
jgi:hypothetical protein